MVLSTPRACATLLLFSAAFACAPTTRPAHPAPAHADDEAIEQALQVDAPECYFLPPAGPITFSVDFSSDGAVKSVRAERSVSLYDDDAYLAEHSATFRAERSLGVRHAEPSVPDGPAVECIAAHLSRALKIPPWPGGLSVQHVSAPHAYDLSSTGGLFDRSTLLAALARVDLSDCAASAGPRRGEAIVWSNPEGGVTRVFVHGPSAGLPLGKCIEHLLGRVQTPPYNGSGNRVLVPYTVPEPAAHQGVKEAGAAH